METASNGGTRNVAVKRGLALAAGVLVLGGVALALAVTALARPFALAELSQRLGRPVHVDGELSLRPALTRFTLHFARLHVDQAGWAGPGALLWIDRGAVTLPWSALLGDVRLQDVGLQGVRLNLRRDDRGRTNWSAGPASGPPRLPRIDRIDLRGGVLDYRNAPRALTFQGAVEVAPDRSGAPVLTIEGHGRSEDGTWSLDGRSTVDPGGAAPYAFSGHLVVDKPSGRSRAAFSGRLARAGGIRVQGVVDGSGPDLHDLSHLINVPLPRTPPYRLHAWVDRTPGSTRVHGVSGRVGGSDVAGAITITPAPGGRRLDGDFHSRSLRISDLFSVASGGHLTRSHIPPDRFLPDTPVNPIPLRKLTGVVRFSADSVQAPTVPTLRSLQLLTTFDRGRVAAAPLVLELPHGRGVVNFGLDVRGAVPRVRFDADLRHADTADFRHGGTQAPLQAAFDAGIHLQGSGLSLSAAASHASGEVSLTGRGGRLQRTQAAVLSGDVLDGVVSALSRDHAETPLVCALARFEVNDGHARARALRVVTGLGAITGSGGFDLASETVDLTLHPAASMMTGVTSVRISGPMIRPRAKLAVAGPVSAVGHVVSSLLHPSAAKPTSPGCG